MTEQGPARRRRYVLYIALILILVPLAGFYLHLRLFSGEVLEYRVSPDGKYVAECRYYYQGGGATTTNLKGVEIRTKLNPFRHTIIDALDYGGELKIRWIDSRNLLVTCPDSSGELDFYGGSETKWHDVSIHYDLDHCQMLR
jgi:hypothetical protein